MKAGEMIVEKEVAESYIVRNDGEWSRIFLQEGAREDGNRWGYISFISGFGNRGHCFSHIGKRPFAEFLVGCDWDYLANKFWGLETRQFDFDESVKALKLLIVEKRRGDDITKDEARECWDEIGDLEPSRDEGFFSAQIYYSCDALMKHADMYESGGVEKVSNPQCDGFRDSIWQPFCEYLKAAAAAKAAA